MNIEKFIPHEFASNSYLVYNDKSAALFDPSLCFDKVSKFIKEKKLDLKYILITHIHFDHVMDVKRFQENYPKLKVFVPVLDKPMYENLKTQCDMFGVRRVEDFFVDEFINEETEFFLDEDKIKIISTPGHSIGSTCYLIGDFLISGDTLFFEEIGRCDLPTGSFSDISLSVRSKLFNLDDNIKVFTGHGDNTTIGHEKEFNIYFGRRAVY